MIRVRSKYIGIPFEDKNCWQLIAHYYREELGIELPCYENEYSNVDDSFNIKKLYDRNIASKIWPKVKVPNYPDLVLFKVINIYHAGIVIGHNCMLHTQRGCNSVIENYTRPRWRKRFYGFYHYENSQL